MNTQTAQYKTTTEKTIYGKAYCKINMYLYIIGKQANGLHIINSLMVFGDLFDEISIQHSNKLQIEYFDKFTEKIYIDQDTISMAVKILENLCGLKINVKISVKKNIPISAGIGGGSSNAATAIKMLIQFLQLKIEEEALHQAINPIGCDTLFCIKNKASIINGTGKINDTSFQEITFKPMPCIMINPLKQVCTTESYKIYSEKFLNINNTNNKLQTNYNILQNLSKFQNDLTKSSTIILPEIKKILSILRDQNGCILSIMSGSGPTCIGIFKNQNLTDIAYKKLINIYKNYFISKVNILDTGNANYITT